MKTSKHPIHYPYKKIYSNIQFISAFEGGGFFKATKDDKHYLIIDEGTMADFLDDNDKDLLDELTTVFEFDTEAELRQYFVKNHLYHKYLGHQSWKEITREERYFCAELFFEIRKDPTRFINFLNTHTYLKLNPDEMWEVGFEVCFYRDYLYSIGQSIKKEYNGIKYPQKRTFDLCLFSKDTLIIIEAKVFENFQKKQLTDLRDDVFSGRLQNLVGYKSRAEYFNIFGLLLHSSEKKIKFDDNTKNFERFTWSDLSKYYDNDIFSKADWLGRRRVRDH